MFIQDEYRRVNFICEKVKYAEIDAIFTCAPRKIAEQIYKGLDGKVELIPTLTGYVPESLVGVERKTISERKIDVGYRARELPFWYGRKSFEKFEIGKLFLEKSHNQRLKCDISSKEKDRIYGNNWIKFLSNCKTTLGTESGASIVDFNGKIEYELNRWQAFHPFSGFDEVPAKFLKQDGEINLQVISPRCFESAALGTVMILYPGIYSNILHKDRHYLMLERDFSNYQEVVEKLHDNEILKNISENAYNDIILSNKYSYCKFIEFFDSQVNRIFDDKNFKPKTPKSLSVDCPKNFNCDTPNKKKNRLLILNLKVHLANLPLKLKLLIEVTILKRKVYHHLFNKE